MELSDPEASTYYIHVQHNNEKVCIFIVDDMRMQILSYLFIISL